MKRCQVLLTWIGAQDPWRPATGRKTGQLEAVPKIRPPEYVDGPILTLLSHVPPFDVIYPLCAPSMRKIGAADALCRDIAKRFPSLNVQLREVPIEDPRAYEPLYRQVRAVCEEARAAEKTAEFHIFLSPGTPQMHAIWVLLAKTVFPAKSWQTSEYPGRPKAEEVHIPFDVDAELIQPVRADVGREPALDLPGFVFSSEAMRRVLSQLRRASRYGSTVLLLGETGVGKSRLARYVHEWSPRAKGPLVTVDCTTLPSSLAESELFGHAPGAFTGATRKRRGLMESASGGTVFLDEIGELPLDVQGKFLRVLEESRIRPVGGDQEVAVDLRVVVATNRDLERMSDEGTFRQDLLARLRAVVVRVPSLRERPEDVLPLIATFLEDENAKRLQHGDPPIRLTGAARNLLRRTPWPGNVRELRHAIHALSVEAGPENEVLDETFVRARIHVAPIRNGNLRNGAGRSLRDATAEFQREIIDEALAQYRTQAAAAKALGLKSPQALQNRMTTLGMERTIVRRRQPVR